MCMDIRKLFLLVIFICSLCKADKNLSFMNIKAVNCPVQESIILSVLDATELLQCAYKCKERSSISLYYAEAEKKCYCNNDTDSNTVMYKGSSELIYGCFGCETNQVCATPPRSDCAAHFGADVTENGVYPLNISGSIVFARCINSSSFGPMTVIQSRDGGAVDFYRGWSEYVAGFGDPNGEHWLGLEHISALTNAAETGHYIYMVPSLADARQLSAFVSYSTFRVEREEDYKVRVDGMRSDCLKESSYIKFGNGDNFVTRDKPGNYKWDVKCAKSAWWMTDCNQFELNGPIYNGKVNAFVKYQACWGDGHPVNKVTMAIVHQQ